jgi:hypothetical protein
LVIANNCVTFSGVISAEYLSEVRKKRESGREEEYPKERERKQGKLIERICTVAEDKRGLL